MRARPSGRAESAWFGVYYWRMRQQLRADMPTRRRVGDERDEMDAVPTAQE
ncbi:MAG: hypothetical protein ACRDID_18475 [Ktedonobacterales bacterium]